MRKLVFVFVIVIVFASPSWSQKKAGKFSIIPRVGLNMNNIGGMNVTTSDNVTHKSAIRTDFMLGADVEYQAKDLLSFSLGAYYSRQGCRWSKYSVVEEEYQEEGVNYAKEVGYQDQAIKLNYLNIPLMANYYVGKYLAFHVGLQCGFAIGDGKWTYSKQDILVNKDTGERTYTPTEEVSSNLKDLNKVVLSIPLGVSFELRKVIIDVRYAFPLTKFYKDKDFCSGSNRVITLSIGYRL